MDGQKVEEFELGEPALVCRWRLAGGALPLENRHLRALSRRVVCGRAVSVQLVSWAKQHIEWTLADGSAQNPDGVLMLVMDAQGRAAMSVGPYEELPASSRTAEALLARAEASAKERAECGVAPETLWGVRGGRLVQRAGEKDVPSGAASLVLDLARTLKIDVEWDAEAALEGLDEVFLCSDEHGIVPAANASGELSARLAACYAKLLDH